MRKLFCLVDLLQVKKNSWEAHEYYGGRHPVNRHPILEMLDFRLGLRASTLPIVKEIASAVLVGYKRCGTGRVMSNDEKRPVLA